VLRWEQYSIAVYGDSCGKLPRAGYVGSVELLLCMVTVVTNYHVELLLCMVTVVTNYHV
jgi:hypothetical protein